MLWVNGLMGEVNTVIKAYYEFLYELFARHRDYLVARAEDLLRGEVRRAGYAGFGGETFAAYLEASVAFIDERIEAYNPIGIQYTFERAGTSEVAELELQLNWYDSTEEFERLVETARDMVEAATGEVNVGVLAEEMAKQCGAFPDGSIIAGYEGGPGLNRLPDYIAAGAMEDAIAAFIR